MDRFLPLLVSGVAYGAVIALVALGFLVLHRATGVVNFAHGDLVTLGAYLGVWATVDLGLPTLGGYALAIAIMAVAGMMLERVAYAPLRRRSQLVVVISTLAAAIVIRAAISLWQGSTPRRLPTPVGDRVWRVGGANITVQRFLVIGVAALAIAALAWLFHRTSFGRQLRAMSTDPAMAQLNGVRVRRVSLAAFALSSSLAGLAGLLVAPITSVTLTFGFAAMLAAFAAAILGGFGSFTGVVVGAIVIGLLQQLFGGYYFRTYAETLPFVLMILVIVIRPAGLFAPSRARL